MTIQSYRTDSQSQVPAVAILQANADGSTSLMGSLGGGSVGAAGVAGTTAQSVQGIAGGVAIPIQGAAAAAASQANPLPIQIAMSTVSTAGGSTLSATTVVGGSLIAKASAGLFFGAQCTSTVAGWLLVYNSATVPADGATTPAHAIPVAAGGFAEIKAGAVPEYFSAGVVLVFSTTGPFAKAISATAFLSAAVH